MKKDKFYSVARVQLEEEGKNHISKQVLDKLRLLDTQAAELRAKGEDPRMVLRDQIDDLATRATIGNQKLSEAYDNEFKEMEAEYKRYVEKHPQQRLAKLQEAKLNNDMLSDEEIKEKARRYSTNPSPIDELDAKETLARLNKIDSEEAKFFKQSAESQQAFTPWLQNEDAQSMLQDQKIVNSLKPGHIAISDGMQAPVHNLVDLDGELDAEA